VSPIQTTVAGPAGVVVGTAGVVEVVGGTGTVVVVLVFVLSVVVGGLVECGAELAGADDVVTGVVSVVELVALVVDVFAVEGVPRLVEVSGDNESSSAAQADTTPSARIATVPRGDSRRRVASTVTARGTGVTA
jgi:hypothetical protein